MRVENNIYQTNFGSKRAKNTNVVVACNEEISGGFAQAYAEGEKLVKRNSSITLPLGSNKRWLVLPLKPENEKLIHVVNMLNLKQTSLEADSLKILRASLKAGLRTVLENPATKVIHYIA